MNPRFITLFAASLSSVNTIKERVTVGVCLWRNAVTLIIFSSFWVSHSLIVLSWSVRRLIVLVLTL